MKELIIDLTINWLKLNLKNKKGLIVILLLSLPISFLVNFQFINSSLVLNNFASLSAQNTIRNISIKNKESLNPIEHYLAEEIQQKWQGTKVTYEYTMSMDYKLKGIRQNALVSFFSGGYNKLNILPFRGSLDEMEFTRQGVRNVAAITYKYWQEKLDSKDVLGEQIIINNKAVEIIAILPESFVSFRNNTNTEIVIPFSQLTTIDISGLTAITPNMFSYVIGTEKSISAIKKSVSSYFQNEGLILPNDYIILNNAIGFDTKEFIQIKNRLTILASVFGLLLAFSFFAFLTYYIGECSDKNEEFQIRKLCGAAIKQLNLQFIIETLLISLLLLFFCLINIPLANLFLTYLFFEDTTSSSQINLFSFTQILISIITLMSVIIFICFVIQKKYIKTSIGRGGNSTLAEKIQSYLLVSALLAISCISITLGLTLIKEQFQLYVVDDGYIANDRYVVTFEFPKSVDLKYVNNEPAKIILQQLLSKKGIENAAFSFVPPLMNRTSYSRWYTANGRTMGSDSQSLINSDNVSPSFFNTIGAKFFKGETLHWDTPDKVVVNKALYNKYLSASNEVSPTLLKVLSSKKGLEDLLPYRVIGVIENILTEGADSQPVPTVYSPTLVMTGAESIIIKSKLNQTQLKNTITQVIKNVDVTLKNHTIHSLEKLKEKENLPRLLVLLTTFIACMIIVTSSLIFCSSILEQFINKNAREYAIRSSLGASFLQLIRYELCLFISTFLSILILLLGIIIGFEESINEAMPYRVDYPYNYFIIITFLYAFAFISALIVKIKLSNKKSWSYLT